MAYINGKKILFSPRIQITGNGSGIDAILSVASLPTENISTNHFYRTTDGVYWWDGEKWHEVAENADLIALQNEVSDISFDTLPDRPFYDDGSTVYTQSEQWYDSTRIQARAYLATTEVLTEAELRKFYVKSIYTDKSSGVEVVTEGAYPLSDARVTNYTGGYILSANVEQSPTPRILVVTDCVAFSNDVGDISLHLNGIYLLDSYNDNFDANNNIYTNTNNVFRLYYSDFKYLDNKFLNLTENEDFKALQKKIEEGGSGGSGGASTWDDLLDKPFGENFTIKETISARTFEGEPYTVKFNNGLGNWGAYRRSEKIYTKEQLLGGKFSATSGDFTIEESHIVEDTEDGLKVQIDQPYYPPYYIWVARTTNYQPEGFDEPFPAVGLYWSSWEAEGGFESLGIHQLDLEYIGVKKLDNKFLDLPKNEDFKALQQKVEEGVVELTIPITYAELKALRDESKLIPGCFYRITDYRCTSVQANTRAMDNRFDIIVRALSSNTLSETASADHHEGDTYFADCNLSAWELKYCLDNDTTRFAWALDYGGMVFPESVLSNGLPLKRIPDADGSMDGTEFEEYRYAWGTQADADDGDTNNYIYSKTETVSAGDIVFSADEGDLFQAEMREGGTGVIYHMKDENNNECPYDFKNIQFKRYLWLDDGAPIYDEDNGEEFWVYTFCGRSYHIDNDEWSELKDGSLESPYAHMNDEGSHAFLENVIKPYTMFYDGGEEIHTNCGKMYLNNNVLLGYWEEIGSSEDEFPYYYAQCCWGNTFGLNCRDNTIERCYGNIFGDKCEGNTLESGSAHNNFGAQWCLQNGHYYHSNFIGRYKVGATLYQHDIRIYYTVKLNEISYVFDLVKTLYTKSSNEITSLREFLSSVGATGKLRDIGGRIAIIDADERYGATITGFSHISLTSFSIGFFDETGSERSMSIPSSASVTDNVMEV